MRKVKKAVMGLAPYRGRDLSYQTVSTPPGWTWTLPFTVEKKGRDFRVDPSFNLQTYAGITVAKTYYVDRSRPDNSGDGLTEATALQKLATALGKTDVDKIMIRGDGNWYEMGYGWDGLSPNRNLEVIGYGSTPPVLSYHHAGLVWSVESNHYRAPETNFIWKVWDKKTVDANGDFIQYQIKLSAAEVDAQAGSFFYDNTNKVLFVRCIDDRAPDADILPSVNGGFVTQNDPVTYYLENLVVYFGSSPITTGSTSLLMKTYLNNVVMKYGFTANGLRAQGGGEVICIDCLAAGNDVDGFKLEESGGAYANCALINCVGRHNGNPTEVLDNGYSRHGRGFTVVVGGSYHHNFGPNVNSIHDGNGAPFDWYLGVTNHSSQAPAASNINFSIGTTGNTGGTAYIDCGTSYGSNTDLAEAVGASMYYRDLVSGGVFTGTPAAY